MKSGLLAAFLVLSPVSALAQDWTGAYGVLGFSSISGERLRYDSGFLTNTHENDGQLTSLAVGYNWQNGNWVFGGELARSTGEITFATLAAENYLDGMIDLKGRVGYAAGKVLLYGTVGWSRSERYFSGPVSNEPIQVDGMSYGLGVDMMVSERVLVGLEYQRRDLSQGVGDMVGFPNEAYDYNVESVGIRLGFRF